MGEQIEAANRPYVTVAIVPNHNSVFYLRIANKGRTGASALSLTVDRDFFTMGRADSNLRDLSAFQEPIQQLPPGSELSFLLASGVQTVGPSVNPSLTPPVFKVTASCSCAGRTVTEVTTIDENPYRGSQFVAATVVDALRGIEDQIKKNG